MRVFACERCGHAVGFDTQRCAACRAELGYEPTSRNLRELLPTAVPAAFTLHDSGRMHWRCLNAAWGCNGILFAHTAAVWCRPCALTRGRPDDDRADATGAWASAEASKRRVIHHLDELGLPITPRSPSAPHGLAFDFVALPGIGGITGVRDGVVTIDLAEVDDLHRDAVRRQFGERFRSVLGHLRHELGHVLWGDLVRDAESIEVFRSSFGDEREPYDSALERHYRAPMGDWDTERFVSAYAASHPAEDWAETFATYLQLLDLVETAGAHGLIAAVRLTGRADGIDLDEARRVWRDLSPALEDLGAALGGHSGFPHDPSEGVMAKLSTVHRLVSRGVQVQT
jgi:hypothetical protein